MDFFLKLKLATLGQKILAKIIFYLSSSQVELYAQLSKIAIMVQSGKGGD